MKNKEAILWLVGIGGFLINVYGVWNAFQFFGESSKYELSLNPIPYLFFLVIGIIAGGVALIAFSKLDRIVKRDNVLGSIRGYKWHYL